MKNFEDWNKFYRILVFQGWINDWQWEIIIHSLQKIKQGRCSFKILDRAVLETIILLRQPVTDLSKIRENRKRRYVDKGSGPHSPTIPSGALQLWQKHWSTESRTRPISMLRSFRFVRKGGCFAASFASGSRGATWMTQIESTPGPRHWLRKTGRTKKTRDQDRKEWARHTGSVAQVVTGAVAGGWLARILRHDARRRSISRPPFSLPPLLPPLLHPILPLFFVRVMQPTAYPTTSHPSNWQLQPAIVYC